MNKTALYLSIGALILSLSSCSLMGPTRVDKKASFSHMPKPNGDWAVVDDLHGADNLFINRKTKSILSINSLCYRYEDSRLDSLMSSLLSPLNVTETLKTEDKMIMERSALVKKVKAKIDGVPVEVLATVLRKNHCVYDFLLQTAGKITKSEEKEYWDFINSIKASSK